MSADHDPPERLIWATRGRFWGFRFLLNGGLPDPLLEYERVFANVEDKPRAWLRADGKVALRFPDPLTRRDAARRIIPHEFVVVGDLALKINSAEDGQQQVWPLVAGAYDRVWEADVPPSLADLHFSTEDNPPTDSVGES